MSIAWLAACAYGCHSDKPASPSAGTGSDGGQDLTEGGRGGETSVAGQNAGGHKALDVPSGGTGGRSIADGAGGAGATGGKKAAGGAGGAAGAPSATTQYVEAVADITEITALDLDQPSDLAFNPYVQDELWVVNHGDSSTTIIKAASQSTRSVERRIDPEASRHFMPQPTGIAFGARETSVVDAAGKMVEGTFATCPEASEAFMGPTLWTSDLRIFAISKEDRQPPFNGDNTGAEGPGSHIDMLHRTPTCTGITWEGAGNIYWTYSGGNAMFVRYDFGKDHGIGNDDHSDGSEWRYEVSGIRYVPNIPSHLAWDAQHKRLYMADTGNARVIQLDPSSITDQTPMAENVDKLQVALDMAGARVSDFIPSSYGLQLPSGVELHDGRLYVSDNQTSVIHRFSLDGEPLGKLTIKDLPPRSLAGISFGPDGKLYFVDMQGSRVLRSETSF